MNQDDENSLNSHPEYVIQTMILDLNQEIFLKTLQNLNSLYQNNKRDSFFTDLFSQIIGTLKIRFNMAKILCKLTCSFYNFVSIQKDQLNKLLEYLIYIFPDNDTYMSESYRLFFLNLLLQENFFDINDVISLISKLFHNFSGISHYLTLIFIWLAPEINENDQPFFQEFHSYFVSIWEFEYTSLVIYNVYTQFEKYRENDWKVLREHRSCEFHQSKASYFIANDSIDDLQHLLNNSKLDLNSRNSPSSYEWRSFLQKCPTFLQIAAFFGSVKCFKYLLLNGANLNNNDFEGKTIAQFAVAGGNNEIIRILHQSNVSFAGTLQVAALFHRNEIFRWILENEISSLNEHHEVTGYVFHQAVISSNYSIMNLCFSQNIDVNSHNSDGIFLYCFFIGHHFTLHHFIIFQKLSAFFFNKKTSTLTVEHHLILHLFTSLQFMEQLMCVIN